MIRELPSIFRPGLITALALALLASPLQSCLEPLSVTCPSGRVCPVGQKCAIREDACIAANGAAFCGDGIIQSGEACDDGNITDGDGCSKTCGSNEYCGNNIVDIGEKCDDGNTQPGDNCSADCKSNEACGNNIVDLAIGEKCDDGNHKDGDGCSNDCLSAEVCGNGIVDTAKGEVCDDGNTQSGDGCSADCHSGEKCRNGFRDPDEECDDGNPNDDDNCLTSCKLATCGDGFIDRELPRTEECDGTGESETCNANCTARACGDGIMNASAGEQCDAGSRDANGNPVPKESNTCDLNCTLAICGDGDVNHTAGEVCDDGNADTCGTCNATCKTKKPPQSAIGRIAATKGSNLKDGEIFSISDGENSTLVFEFDDNGFRPSTHIPIEFAGGDSRLTIAQTIESAIKEAVSNAILNISVTTDSAGVVTLKNNKEGTFGNQPIIESVENENFAVTPMSGGSGYDCQLGMGCKSEQDCLRGLTCQIQSGQQRETCN